MIRIGKTNLKNSDKLLNEVKHQTTNQPTHFKMAGQDTDLQESVRPKSRADLDHRALPTIQPAYDTHDPQTGDIGAVLKRNREQRDITHLMNIWFSFFRESTCI